MMTSSGSARSVKSTLSACPVPAGNHGMDHARGVAVGRCRRRVLVGARALSAVTLHFRKWHKAGIFGTAAKLTITQRGALRCSILMRCGLRTDILLSSVRGEPDQMER